jgi:transglutaminase-like putative cysteine protease
VKKTKILVLICLLMMLLACSSLGPVQETLTPPQATPIPDTATPSPSPFITATFDSTSSSVEYKVKQTIHFVNEGIGEVSRLLATVALIRDYAPNQEVLQMHITPGTYSLINDEYGNTYAQIEITDLPSQQSTEVEITYLVRVYEVRVKVGECVGKLPSDLTSSERYIESNSRQILDLSTSLTKDSKTPCDETRAFYDYVTENMTYSGYNPGDAGARQAALTLSGDCTEFSDLLTALNRSVGIPARFMEGVMCCTDLGYDEGQIKHNWVEVYLPGTGWAPMDPTFGRFPTDREEYFAHMTPDHIIVTTGRNLSTLMGYHYYAYRFWWDADPTNITTRETWSILKSGQ